MQHWPGQLARELAAVLLPARFHVQPLIAGLPHVVQECLRCQAGQGDALGGQRDRDVEQRRSVVYRVHRMVLDALPEVLQQRIVLGRQESFSVAVEPGRPQRQQRWADDAESEQAGGTSADLLAPLVGRDQHVDRLACFIQPAGLPALLPRPAREAVQVLQQDAGAAAPPVLRVTAARPDPAHHRLDLLRARARKVSVGSGTDDGQQGLRRLQARETRRHDPQVGGELGHRRLSHRRPP